MAASGKKRNRESSSSGGGVCAKMHVCKLTYRGGARCAKNKCSYYLDPKDTKAKNYMLKKRS